MTGFFSTFGPERIKKTSPVKVKRLLGVMVNDAFVQPVKCEHCEQGIELGSDWEEGLAFCPGCQSEVRVFFYPKCPIKF